MGDRFAWSPVEVAEDTREGKLVEEVDEVVRNVRKVAEEEENEKENKEQIEGRFVGKEVLCSLGLADVSMRKCNKEQFDQRRKVCVNYKLLVAVLTKAVRCGDPVCPTR